jgi:hypothetical protein
MSDKAETIDIFGTRSEVVKFSRLIDLESAAVGAEPTFAAACDQWQVSQNANIRL